MTPVVTASEPCSRADGQRVEHLAQGLAEDAPQVRGAQRQLGAFLLDVVQLLAEEAKVPSFFAERHDGIAEQGVDGRLDGVRARRGVDGRVHQAGDVLHRHRQVAEDLQHGDGLGDVLVERRVRKADLDLADRLVDRGEGPADVLLQRVVQGDGGRQPADR